MEDAKYLRPGKSGQDLSWALLLAPKVDHPASAALQRHFEEQIVGTGVCQTASISGNDPVKPSNYHEDTMRVALNRLIEHNAPKLPDIVVLLIPVKDRVACSPFNYLTDKQFVLQSICIAVTRMRPKSKEGYGGLTTMAQYMANVAMEANLKLAGIDHSSVTNRSWLQNTLILRADVTNPGSSASQGSLSIAALVGSMETDGGRYIGEMVLQPGGQEVCHREWYLSIH